MNVNLQAVESHAASLHATQAPHSCRPGTVYSVPVPRTPLLTRALPNVTWSDAYAVFVEIDPRESDPHAWTEAVFRGAPSWVRVLFGVRHVLVRAVGIEPGDSHVFDALDWRRDEVLVGTDQEHLSFRASVLVEPGRVVVSTVVEVHNRRGRAYSALVRRVHPIVVRGMLSRAVQKMEAAS
jgi:Protein of unknown function (DUF2867)